MRVEMTCLGVKLVRRAEVVANTYNPNVVSDDKMELLRRSILDNGFCFPIVTIRDEERGVYVVVDGFHRLTICQPEWLDIDPVPVVVLAHGMAQRMIATVQFNKARGVHQVDLDAEVIRALAEQGLGDDEIAVHLGVDVDTVYRYKQVAGVAELFRSTPYSTAWEMVDGADERGGREP